MAGRALTRRCPLCGGADAYFRGYFSTIERCRTCGFRVERGMAGYMTGTMAVSVIITFAAMGAVFAGFLVATYPDPPVGPIVAVLLVMGVVLPVVLRPFCYSLWFAVDLAMRQPERVELDDAAAHAGDPTALASFRSATDARNT